MLRWRRNRMNRWAEQLVSLLELKYPGVEHDMATIRRHDISSASRETVAGILKAKLSNLPRLHVHACLQYGEACGIMLALGMISGSELDAIERL